MTHEAKKKTAGRLKSRPEFLAVRNGEKRKGKYFLLEVLDREAARRDSSGAGNPDHDDAPRVGFTVTKKHGNAVERNRMRRRLREAVRLSAQFAMKPGHDYVIVARRDILKTPFAALTAELNDRIGSRRKQFQQKNEPVLREELRETGDSTRPSGAGRPRKV